MIYGPAEERYALGRKRLAEGITREALACFREAIELERTHGVEDRRGQGRYHSFYGLCLCITRTSTRDALQECRTGAALDPINPDVWWNLGKVALHFHRRGEAYRAWKRGLELDPSHDGMRHEMDHLGTRREPVLSFVSRRHPLNVALGHVRARLAQPVTAGRVRQQSRRVAGARR